MEGKMMVTKDDVPRCGDQSPPKSDSDDDEFGVPRCGGKSPPESDSDDVKADVPRRGGKCPPESDSDDDDEGYNSQCAECAEIAIQHINQVQGVQYELVDIGRSSAFSERYENCTYFHSNFTAKPQGSSLSETKLIFAELKAGCYIPFFLNKYCILGTPDQVSTGLNGCLACGPKSDDNLHHPLDQDLFYVGTERMSFLK